MPTRDDGSVVVADAVDHEAHELLGLHRALSIRELEADHRRYLPYDRLGVSDSASAADLRTAWRVRHLESGSRAAGPTERTTDERAFIIFAHPDLR